MAVNLEEADAPNVEANKLSLTLFRRPEKFKIGEDFDLFIKKSNLHFEAVELILFYFILHVCHYKSTNTIYNYTTMISHKDYINISHKYYDGWNDHTEIKSPITGFHNIH